MRSLKYEQLFLSAEFLYCCSCNKVQLADKLKEYLEGQMVSSKKKEVFKDSKEQKIIMIKLFSRDSNLRNSSVSPLVSLSVCLSVCYEVV